MRSLIAAVALGLTAALVSVNGIEGAHADTVLTSSDDGRIGTGKAAGGKIQWALKRVSGYGRVAIIKTPSRQAIRYRCLGNPGGFDRVVMKGRVKRGQRDVWFVGSRPARTYRMHCKLR